MGGYFYYMNNVIIQYVRNWTNIRHCRNLRP